MRFVAALTLVAGVLGFSACTGQTEPTSSGSTISEESSTEKLGAGTSASTAGGESAEWQCPITPDQLVAAFPDLPVYFQVADGRTDVAFDSRTESLPSAMTTYTFEGETKCSALLNDTKNEEGGKTPKATLLAFLKPTPTPAEDAKDEAVEVWRQLDVFVGESSVCPGGFGVETDFGFDVFISTSGGSAKVSVIRADGDFAALSAGLSAVCEIIGTT